MSETRMSLLICFLVVFLNGAFAQKSVRDVSVTDYGLHPGDGKAAAACRPSQ